MICQPVCIADGILFWVPLLVDSMLNGTFNGKAPKAVRKSPIRFSLLGERVLGFHTQMCSAKTCFPEPHRPTKCPIGFWLAELAWYLPAGHVVVHIVCIPVNNKLLHVVTPVPDAANRAACRPYSEGAGAVLCQAGLHFGHLVRSRHPHNHLQLVALQAHRRAAVPHCHPTVLQWHCLHVSAHFPATCELAQLHTAQAQDVVLHLWSATSFAGLPPQQCLVRHRKGPALNVYT